MNAVTVLGLAGTAAFIIYGMNRQIFTSRESLQMFLDGFGIFAPVIFTAIQIVQVVVPILPGAIGCLGGVLILVLSGVLSIIIRGSASAPSLSSYCRNDMGNR